MSGLIGMLMHKSTHNASGTAATTGMVPATPTLIAKEFTGAHLALRNLIANAAILHHSSTARTEDSCGSSRWKKGVVETH